MNKMRKIHGGVCAAEGFLAGATGCGIKPGRAARDDLAGLPKRYRALCRPKLLGLNLDEKVALAARVLRADSARTGRAGTTPGAR